MYTCTHAHNFHTTSTPTHTDTYPHIPAEEVRATAGGGARVEAGGGALAVAGRESRGVAAVRAPAKLVTSPCVCVCVCVFVCV